MKCKCKYYKIVDGKLVCSVCGKLLIIEPKIEDKVVEKHETKEAGNVHRT